MFKTRQQKAIYLILVLLLVILFMTQLFGGRLDFILHETYSISTDTLREHAKDFSLEGDGFVAQSNDPWFEIEIPRGRYGRLMVDVVSLSQPLTTCKIYYCLSENSLFSEDQCVSKKLTQQKNIITLPKQDIDRLRIDLTDEEGVSIELNGIELVGENSAINPRGCISVLGTLLIILLLFIPISSLMVKELAVFKGGIRRIVRESPKSLLALLMIVSIMICFGRYMFGGRYFAFLDVGSDMVYDYQTKWFSMADDFSAGRAAAYTFNNGLGTSSLTQITWLLDPFLWPTLIVYLLVGFNAAQVTIAWMHGLKLLFCALLCYDYLSEFSLNNVAKIVASYIFGFCGFLIVWGQHYMFSTCFLISMLVLLCLERAVKQEKIGKQHLLLTLSVAWLASKTYYFAYMSLLSMAVYVIFRLFYVYPIRDFRRWMSGGIKILLCVLLGFMTSAVFLLPQMHEIMSVSNRISNGGSIFQYFGFFEPEHMKTLLSRVLSNNLLGIRDYQGYLNYYESDQLFFSSFMPLFLVLYVLLSLQEGRKTFVIRLTGVIVLCFLTVIPVTGYIMNAFVYPSLRYTYVFMPIYAYIAAKVIDGIINRRVSILQLILAMIPYPIIINYISDTPGYSDSLCQFLMALVISGVVLIGMYRLFPKAGKYFMALLVGVILVNVLRDSWMTTNLRTTLDERYSRRDITEMTTTVKSIKDKLIESDPDLYRIEKTYSDYSFWNDAMIEDYYGVSGYNAQINAALSDFYRNCWSEVIYFADGRQIQFERDYKNVDMVSLVGIKYLISDEIINDVPAYSLYDKVSGKYVYINNDYQGFGRFYTKTITKDDFFSHTNEEADALLKDYIILEQQEKLTEAQGEVSIPFPAKDDHIEVNVSADGNGYVFLPIPYEGGWKATVDGVSQTILKADFGFMAIPVVSGYSRIVMDYHIPMLKEGVLLSAVGVIIIGMLVVLNRKSAKRELKNQRRVSEVSGQST